MDATSLIRGKLYQGGAPSSLPQLLRHRFDVVVLCAQEYQPPDALFGMIQVIRCPIDDALDAPDSHYRAAVSTGLKVADAVMADARVLVTCMAGRNRSGLVSGIALHTLTGKSGRECADYIRARRANALTNEAFYRELCHLPAREHLQRLRLR